MDIDLCMFRSTDEEGEVTEIIRPESKSWQDIIQVMNHHQGKNDKVVMLFVDMYSMSFQWDWYEAYSAWEEKVKEIMEQNENLQPGEQPIPLPDAPERPKIESNQSIYDRAMAEIDHDFDDITNWRQTVEQAQKSKAG